MPEQYVKRARHGEGFLVAFAEIERKVHRASESILKFDQICYYRPHLWLKGLNNVVLLQIKRRGEESGGKEVG